MTAVRPTRRGGFTLIELLVVIGLIALLAAIAVGAYSLVLGGQAKRNTESTVNKIETLLGTKRAAVLRQASTEPLPPAVVTYAKISTEADSPPILERARAMWMYLRLLQEFPTSQTEAAGQIKLPATTGTVVLNPRTSNQIKPEADPYFASAACLYKAVMESATSSSAASQDGLQNKIMRTVAGNDVFRDEWNNPIAFVRLAYATELNSPPYFNSVVGNPDRNDPTNRLTTDPNWIATGKLPGFWTAAAGSHLNYTGFPLSAYVDQYSVMAIISAGPDKLFVDATNGSPFGNDGAAADNIVSYRLVATAGNGSR